MKYIICIILCAIIYIAGDIYTMMQTANSFGNIMLEQAEHETERARKITKILKK